MKILVCISHVPDTTSKINFVNGDSEFDTNGVQYVINPNDEFGLTRAIWFQEQQAATVTVVNVGGADTDMGHQVHSWPAGWAYQQLAGSAVEPLPSGDRAGAGSPSGGGGGGGHLWLADLGGRQCPGNGAASRGAPG